jgi:hypothetical protein
MGDVWRMPDFRPGHFDGVFGSNAMRTLTSCCALAIAAVGLSVLFAGDDAEQKPIRKRRPAAVVKQPRRVIAAKKAVVRQRDEQPLGKTVRLTFTVTNGDGDHSFPVLCAARSFLINHNIAEAEGGHELKFAGYLKAVDQTDRVFLSFDAFQAHSNNNEAFDATFKLQGSALVRFGRKTELGKLGEDKVTLTATLVE